MIAKEIVKLITPPLFIKMGKRLLPREDKQVSQWEYIPEGWAYARTHPEVKGWDVPDVLQTYQVKWGKFLEMSKGAGPLGVSLESAQITHADVSSHNVIMVFAYALALAARKRDSISMLDWGGGVGHYYVLAKALLPDVRIEYHCKDLPRLSAYGAQLFPEQHFYANDDCFEHSYDFVLASSSLHYVEDWQSMLERLAKATSGYMLITRLPVTLQSPSFVFIQRPYSFGYNTEYLAWCFSRADFLRNLDCSGLKLVREFIIGEPVLVANAPEPFQNRGFLLKRT